MDTAQPRPGHGAAEAGEHRGSCGTSQLWNNLEQREEGGRDGLAPKYLAWLRARHGTSGTQNPAKFHAKENSQI